MVTVVTLWLYPFISTIAPAPIANKNKRGKKKATFLRKSTPKRSSEPRYLAPWTTYLYDQDDT